MTQHFVKQIQFELWANQKTAEAIEVAVEPDERTFFLFTHILNANSIWLSRLQNTPVTTTLFQERSFEDSKALMKEVAEKWTTYIATLGEKELGRSVHFIFPFDGSKKKILIADAITHVFGHSAYHRGQIIARLKGKLEPLPLLAYVVFASEADN
ncbi:DinB family protein [Ferruginibacter sp. SUN106]|uniref:DinB family protein n=1 Tax=Ferruginibacter sp. SUN106 TaxID=2978348 RepID=UPI003D36A930